MGTEDTGHVLAHMIFRACMGTEGTGGSVGTKDTEGSAGTEDTGQVWTQRTLRAVEA